MNETSLFTKSLLVIDDDESFRQMTTLMGEMLGWQVIEARNCCDGLRILGERLSEIGLIFLDYYMPGLSPTDCAKAIKEIVGDAAPIVLVTGAVDPQANAHSLQLEHWLAKPFGYEDFKRTLFSFRPMGSLAPSPQTQLDCR